MLSDITNARAGVQESYSSAVGTSNLRVTTDRRTPADMILAAGMNRQRTGTALMRLLSEWDRASKPIPPTGAAIEALASTLDKEPSGLVAETVDGEVRYRTPAAVAADRAAEWHLHELKLLMQGLKTLGTVRDALHFYLTAEGVEDPGYVVAAVLQWWLSPSCPVCHGVGERIVKGTNRTSGIACGTCRGKKERKVPHGMRGRKLLTYINECLKWARDGLQGKFKPEKRDRRDSVAASRMLVRVGQRWRARNGTLWDIVIREEQFDGRQKLWGIAAGTEDRWRIWGSAGAPWGSVLGGPRTYDLVDLLPEPAR